MVGAETEKHLLQCTKHCILKFVGTTNILYHGMARKVHRGAQILTQACAFENFIFFPGMVQLFHPVLPHHYVVT